MLGLRISQAGDFAVVFGGAKASGLCLQCSLAAADFLHVCVWRGRRQLLPAHANVFLRDSIIEENCLIGPSGNRIQGDRTLDYFIAHEITHTLTGQAVGPIAYHRLPQWKREGYADYAGKGAAFNYDEAKRAFLANDSKMDYAKSGLYWRFHLLVAHLLEKQHWSAQRVLTERIEQQPVEDNRRV